MKYSNLIEMLRAEPIYFPEKYRDFEIEFAGASDLMSDFLAFSRENMLLITGLTSPQTITTAAVIGANGIIFVRGKELPSNVVEISKDLDIPIFVTDFSMYVACALLYKNKVKDAMETDKGIKNE